MGSYMAYRHHIPDDNTSTDIENTDTVQLSKVELAELVDE
jgi:hypothetical protein